MANNSKKTNNKSGKKGASVKVTNKVDKSTVSLKPVVDETNVPAPDTEEKKDNITNLMDSIVNDSKETLTEEQTNDFIEQKEAELAAARVTEEEKQLHDHVEESDNDNTEEVTETPQENEQEIVPETEVPLEKETSEFELSKDTVIKEAHIDEEKQLVMSLGTPDGTAEVKLDIKELMEEKPKKRRTTVEMLGYDWLGQSYD